MGLFPRIRDFLGDLLEMGLAVAERRYVSFDAFWLLFDGVEQRMAFVGVTFTSVSRVFLLDLPCESS